MNFNKKKIITILIILNLLGILNIIYYINTIGVDKLAVQMIRICMTFLLTFCVYLEMNWAKWTLSILSFIGGIWGIVFSMLTISKSTEYFLLIPVSIFYLFVSVYVHITDELKTREMIQKSLEELDINTVNYS